MQYTLPWMPFYGDDFFGSREVSEMTPENQLRYLRLLWYAFKHGSIPADLEAIACVGGFTNFDPDRVWRVLGPLFVPHPSVPDRLVNPRAERERSKALVLSDRRRAAGARGGRAKAERRPSPATTENTRLPSPDESATDASLVEPAAGKQNSSRATNLLPENPSPALHIRHSTAETNVSAMSNSHEFAIGAADETSTNGDGSRGEPALASVAVTPPKAPTEPTLPAAAAPPQEPPPKPPRKPFEPSPAEVEAYAILSAVEPVVFRHVPDIAVTRKAWRQRNKAAAMTFVELGGWPPERIVGLVTYAYTDPEARAFYGQVTMLAKFAEYAPRIIAMRDGRTGIPGRAARKDRAFSLALR